MSSPQNVEKKRLLQLDVLRGLAILLVLGRHSPLKWEEAGLFKYFAGVWMRIGWSGVDLFFVLSGFLVGGLLFKELHTRSRLDVRRFIIRRGFKIWPSYYINVLVGTGIVLWQLNGDVGQTFRALFPNYLHIQNYFLKPESPVWGALGPTWSLAIEEHFYLALPLLLLFLTRRQAIPVRAIPAVPRIVVGVIIFCTALRCYLLWRSPTVDLTTFGMQTHLRIDGLAFGVLLAYLYHFQPRVFEAVPRYRGWILLASLAFLSPLFLFERSRAPFLASFGYTFIYIGYGLLLVAVVTTPLGEGPFGKLLGSPLARAVGFIGFYSYTIYLWHLLVAVRPMEALIARGFHVGPPTLNWLCVISATVALAVAGGVIAGRLVDLPALALRDRLFPSRADALGKPPEKSN